MSTIVYDENGLRKVNALESSSIGGRVDDDGTALALPTGWTSSYSAPTYRVTHNFGHQFYAPTVTAITGAGHASAQLTDIQDNYFEYVVFNDENGNIAMPCSFVVAPIV